MNVLIVFSPEAVRRGVARIKRLSELRDPSYTLPADSYLQEAVLDIMAFGYFDHPRLETDSDE